MPFEQRSLSGAFPEPPCVSCAAALYVAVDAAAPAVWSMHGEGQSVIFVTYVRHSLHTQATYVTSVTASAAQGTRPRAPLREPHHTSWGHPRDGGWQRRLLLLPRSRPPASSSSSWSARRRPSCARQLRFHHIELHHLGLHHLVFGLAPCTDVFVFCTESVIHPLAYTVT